MIDYCQCEKEGTIVLDKLAHIGIPTARTFYRTIGFLLLDEELKEGKERQVTRRNLYGKNQTIIYSLDSLNSQIQAANNFLNNYYKEK